MELKETQAKIYKLRGRMCYLENCLFIASIDTEILQEMLKSTTNQGIALMYEMELAYRGLL